MRPSVLTKYFHLFEAVLLVKIPSAQIHKRSKIVEVKVDTVEIKM